MAVHEYPQSHGSLAGLSDTDHHTQYPLLAQGPASSRPTGPWRFGRIYRSTDTRAMHFDTGAAWAGLGVLDVPQTWTARQDFTATDANTIPVFITGAAGQAVSILQVRRNGATYPSLEVWKDGLVYLQDGVYVYPFSATSIGLQVDYAGTTQSADLVRVYKPPTAGDTALRITGQGEVTLGSTSTSAGFHVAFNQIMSY